MSTQTAVEQKSTQYPGAKPGTGDPAGNGGAGNGTGDPGTLPVPAQAGGAEQKLKAERVQEELKAMTGWAAIDRETAIENVKTFATPDLAGLYGGFVIQSAAATGHPVAVSVNGNQVCVTLYTPDIDGCPGELTLPVLAFARQL
jgi:pterin-4a-carbinolamine dehydratase